MEDRWIKACWTLWMSWLHDGLLFQRITTVRLSQFREEIRKEFGDRLEHATPANVREFLDTFQQKLNQSSMHQRMVLNEPKTTYEEIIKDFFSRVLDYPTEEALMLMWTMAFDLSFSALEMQLAERFNTLFGEIGEDNEK